MSANGASSRDKIPMAKAPTPDDRSSPDEIVEADIDVSTLITLRVTYRVAHARPYSVSEVFFAARRKVYRRGRKSGAFD